MTRNVKVLILLFNCVINLMRGESIGEILPGGGMSKFSASYGQGTSPLQSLQQERPCMMCSKYILVLHSYYITYSSTIIQYTNNIILLQYILLQYILCLCVCPETPANAKSKMHITVVNKSNRTGTTTIICWQENKLDQTMMTSSLRNVIYDIHFTNSEIC